MDRRTSLGFILIALALVFMILLTKPSSQQAAREKQYEQKADSARISKLDAVPVQDTAVDSLSPLLPSMTGQEKTVMLINDHVKVGISTKGGMPCFVQLSNYNDQKGGNVVIFDNSEISFNLKLDGKNRNISTRDLFFVPIEESESGVTMRLNTNGYGFLDFIYTLDSENYMVNMEIRANGMSDFFSTNTDRLSIDWIQNLRQQEKGFEFEQRYTTLTYKRSDKNRTKYLMVTKGSRTTNILQSLDWVAFKNQFFSCILISPDKFGENSRLSTAAYTKGNGYLKKMSVSLDTRFDPTGSEPTRLQFYLGPNDYRILRAANHLAYGNQKLRLHKIIDLGWPVVREVNRFFIMPLFNFLSRYNMNMGLVLLLLTVIVKAIVYPFTRKSFMSSAKMRALKPYIDEVNALYPKPEDAMKKQQETMAVYSKYGVSPMGGCLPSLIQMPIWMALFFFIPNAIELRQQSFLWATDLTGFDDIIHWSKNIWGIGNHLSIFCLLFCLANIINTVITMKQQQTAAPGQEDTMKIMRWSMYLMPVIFFFTFNNYSSGLCYYYFISALTSIITMIYLRRTTDEEELRRELEANYEANRNDPRKSRANTMMARLEAIQKEQERLQNQQKKNAR
ncbi:MAG: membrane protein insertase YidC [Bacteroidaceae bacterium]|nr:membrane protein insertase YidC [Bacteroidaceae bacterium]